jgi:hypothetical protein
MAVIWAAVNGVDPVALNLLVIALKLAIAVVIWAADLTPSVG